MALFNNFCQVPKPKNMILITKTTYSIDILISQAQLQQLIFDIIDNIITKTT